MRSGVRPRTQLRHVSACCPSRRRSEARRSASARFRPSVLARAPRVSRRRGPARSCRESNPTPEPGYPGPMRIATWNVNSLKARLEQGARGGSSAPGPTSCSCRRRSSPTPTRPRRLPRRRATSSRTTARGAGTASRSRAASASRTSSRTSASRCGRRETADAGDDEPLAEARMIAASCGGVRVVCIYAPNGRVVGLAVLRRPSSPGSTGSRAGSREAAIPSEPLVLGGDFNVAPADADVWDPRGLPRRHARLAARSAQAFARLCAWGLVDAYRQHAPEPERYTWWDYRAGNFHKNFGMRIDHLLVSPPLAARVVWTEIDREARKGKPIAVRPRAARHRPRRARAVPSTRAGPSAEGRIAAGRGRAPGDPSSRRSSRCSRSSPTSCRTATAGSTSRSGTAFARSSSATATTSSSRAATCKPLDRYFPELARAAAARRCRERLRGRRRDRDRRRRAGLDFDALQLRLHPAASRVAKLAAETPASFVAFDLLAVGDEDLRARAAGRAPRAGSRRLLARAQPPIHLTPMTRDRAVAADWFERFEGAGLDGVIAKPDERDVPARQARDDQDQARAHRRLRRRRLPLAQERRGRARRLAAARALRRRRRAAPRRRDVVVHDGGARAELATELAPLRERRARRRIRGASGRTRPRRRWRGCPAGRAAGAPGKDLSWEPLRIERVCEVEVRPPAGRSLPPRAPSSSAGAPTSRRPTAATISSRSRRLTSSRRSSAAASGRQG